MPYYERVNLTSTLLQLPIWRSRAAGTVGDGEEVLEIGPGPGGFAGLLHCYRVYLLEPSVPMIKYSARRLSAGRYRPVIGLAEDIPLKEASVDKVFCVFSFRDFMNKNGALREVYRVLRPGGQLHVVDLFRAIGPLRRLMMELWLKRGAGTILRLAVPRKARKGWKHDPYHQLMVTYRGIGTAYEYEGLMREVGFKEVKSTDLLLGSVHYLQGAKPSTT